MKPVDLGTFRGSGPNETLQQPAAAILVLRNTKLFQAAAGGELYRSG